MFFPLSGFRLITFDVPPGPITMDAIADIAAALLDHLGVPAAVVGGVSMGGYATFRFLARHAARLLGLLLSNTRAAADTEQARAARYEMMETARRYGAAEIAKAMLPRLLGETTRRESPALVERARQMIESASPEWIVHLLEALANRPDSTPLLPSISVPAVVLGGDEDLIVTAAETRSWAALIPTAQVTILPRCGHLPPLEQPAAFSAALRPLLRAAVR
jgi:3-oxoadipate enol-lactonase